MTEYPATHNTLSTQKHPLPFLELVEGCRDSAQQKHKVVTLALQNCQAKGCERDPVNRGGRHLPTRTGARIWAERE